MASIMLNRMKKSSGQHSSPRTGWLSIGYCEQISTLRQNYRLRTDLSHQLHMFHISRFWQCSLSVTVGNFEFLWYPWKKLRNIVQSLLWQQKRRWNQSPTLWLVWIMFTCLTRLSALTLLFVIVMDWCIKHAIQT